MDFEIFTMPNNDIANYVCHFRHEDRYCKVTGFVTKNKDGSLNTIISKKSAFNEFNIKEAVKNAIQNAK